RVQAQTLVQGTLYLVVEGDLVKLGQRLHEMQMCVRAFVARYLDNRLRVRSHDGRPIAREMLKPTAIFSVVRVLLDFVIKIDCPPQGLLVPAGAVVLDQGVNDKGLPVKDLAVVQDFAREVGGPEIPSIFLVEKVLEQEPV